MKNTTLDSRWCKTFEYTKKNDRNHEWKKVNKLIDIDNFSILFVNCLQLAETEQLKT